MRARPTAGMWAAVARVALPATPVIGMRCRAASNAAKGAVKSISAALSWFPRARPRYDVLPSPHKGPWHLRCASNAPVSQLRCNHDICRVPRVIRDRGK